MTNEGKAKEIAGGLNFPISNYDYGKYDGSLEMAQWKDQQFTSIIEGKLNYARKMIKENNGKSVCLKYTGMRKILIEIKNELRNKK